MSCIDEETLSGYRLFENQKFTVDDGIDGQFAPVTVVGWSATIEANHDNRKHLLFLDVYDLRLVEVTRYLSWVQYCRNEAA